MIIDQDLVYVDHEVLTLPDGWRMTTLADLITEEGLFCDGDWVESKDQDPNGDVRLIQLADIGVGSYRDRSDRYLTSERASALSCSFLKRGDILIARMPDPLGRACIFPGDKRRAVTVVDVAIVRPNNPEVSNRWLMHRVNSIAFRNAVASLQSGSTRLRISRKNLARIAFPLPPLIQQLSALEEIETQFSRLDEAVANLQRVKANLKRYKASVLKAAVEGRLVETEASIAQREGRSYETGEQLLKRILEERRVKWTGRGKYKPPVKPSADGHGVLPEGWTIATADQLTYLITSGSRGWGDFYSDAGILFIRAQDIKTDALNLHDAARVDVPVDAEGTRSSVTAGDILVTITGANVTKSALVPELDELAFVSQHVALMKLTQPETAPFVFNWIVSPSNGRKTLESWAYGAGKPGLSLEQVRSLPIAFPPLAEQTRIAAEVDRHLSIIREVEAEISVNLNRAQAIRQATLKSCFQRKGS